MADEPVKDSKDAMLTPETISNLTKVFKGVKDGGVVVASGLTIWVMVTFGFAETPMARSTYQNDIRSQLVIINDKLTALKSAQEDYITRSEFRYRLLEFAVTNNLKTEQMIPLKATNAP